MVFDNYEVIIASENDPSAADGAIIDNSEDEEAIGRRKQERRRSRTGRESEQQKPDHRTDRSFKLDARQRL